MFWWGGGGDEPNGGPGDEHPLQSVLSLDSDSLLKLLSEEIERKSKESYTKIWHGTLDAITHVIAGIHTYTYSYIYSGSHVLAAGVIPLLEF